MVKEKNIGLNKYFICQECNLFYLDKNKAESCEQWCKNNKGTCNPDIIRYSIKIKL